MLLHIGTKLSHITLHPTSVNCSFSARQQQGHTQQESKYDCEEFHRRTLSGMAEYLSLSACWLNELQPVTLLACLMHLFQPPREHHRHMIVDHIYQEMFATQEILKGGFLQPVLLRYTGIILTTGLR